ncbi:MAG: hypothetical protein WCO25_00715 [Candidatus Uhrbacteria bacterium]
MEPKLILIVCPKTHQTFFERSLREALDKERICYVFVHCDTVADAAASMDQAGYPDFVVCDKDAGAEDAYFDLLRKVRHAGESMPFVVWSTSFHPDTAGLITRLNALTVSWGTPGGLARLNRYAVTLLHGQRRALVS